MPLGFKGNILTTSSSASGPIETDSIVWSVPGTGGGSLNSVVGIQQINGSQDLNTAISQLSGDAVTGRNGPMVLIAPGDYDIVLTGADIRDAGQNVNLTIVYGQLTGTSSSDYNFTNTVSSASFTDSSPDGNGDYDFGHIQGDTILSFTHTSSRASSNYGVGVKVTPTQKVRRIFVNFVRTA